MTLHRLAQADWNHVCNDGLPELAPAETIQPVDHPFRHAVSPWVYCPAWAALAFVLTVIGSLTL